jgi:peptidyl-prolyl cis-trans isomerase SurA
MKYFFWVIPAVLFSFCTADAKTVDRILVQVNDDIITMSEVNRELADFRREAETKYSGEQLEDMVQKAEKQVVENLIQQKLLYQKAIELGFNANVDTRVSAYLQEIIKRYKLKDTDELEKALEQQGTTLRDFRERIRKEMINRDLVQEFVGSRITLLYQEVEKYYKDHESEFSTPEEVTLSEIVLPTNGDDAGTLERANEICRRAAQGESFATLASQYSKGVTANKGGSSGTYEIGKLNPETVSAIANLKESELSKPQKLKDSYVIYRIDSRKPAVVPPLDQVRDQIRDRLYEKKFAPEFDRFIAQLKEDAYIQYFTEIK